MSWLRVGKSGVVMCNGKFFCDGARRKKLLRCATADSVLMRRRCAVADPDELRVVGTAAARRIREKQHDTDPNRRRRRRRCHRRRAFARFREWRSATAAHRHGRLRACGGGNERTYTHTRARGILLQTHACVCVRVGGVRCATGRYALSEKKG